MKICKKFCFWVEKISLMIYFTIKYVLNKKQDFMNISATGGARNIGAGIVLKFAEAGNSVAFCGRYRCPNA